MSYPYFQSMPSLTHCPKILSQVLLMFLFLDTVTERFHGMVKIGYSFLLVLKVRARLKRLAMPIVCPGANPSMKILLTNHRFSREGSILWLVVPNVIATVV